MELSKNQAALILGLSDTGEINVDVAAADLDGLPGDRLGGHKGTTKDRNGRTIKTTTRSIRALDRNIKLNHVLWY